MILNYIFNFIVAIINAVFSWLPRVTELPLGIDGYFSSAVQSFKAFAEIFPPLGVIFTAFMWYLGFKITLLTLRLFRVIPQL